MRRSGWILTLAAAIGCGALAGPAVASPNRPVSASFPGWRVVWSGPGGGQSGFKSVAAISKTDAWAVGIEGLNAGSHGFIVHWGGRRWRYVALPALGLLPLEVRATSATDVWVFGAYQGSGIGFRWDGTRWHQTTPLGAAFAGGDVAVLGPSDVWFGAPSCASGAVCPAWHWNGSAWITVALPPHVVLQGLAGSAPSNLWMAGYLQPRSGVYRGLLVAYRWVKNAWAKVRLPWALSVRLASVVTTSPSSVWIVNTLTNFPRPLHWNGTRWQRLPAMPPPGDVGEPLAPFGRSGLRVGAAEAWNGRTWVVGRAPYDGDDIAAVPGTSSAWMVGAWFASGTGLTGEIQFSS
jgi:hypothetical protein